MAKRLMCIVLSVLMIIAVLPTGVVAEDEPTWKEISSLSSSTITESGYYRLTAYSSNTLYIQKDMNVVIDLNGYSSSGSIIVYSGGTLDIYDTANSQAGISSVISAYGGTVNIHSGTFGNRVYASDGGTLNISGGTFNTRASNIGDLGGVFAADNGTVNITGGTFKSKVGIFRPSSHYGYLGFSTTSWSTTDVEANVCYATVNIYDGTFDNDVKIFRDAYYQNNTSTYSDGAVVITDSSINISGGTFNSTVSNENTTESNVLTVTGGSFLTSENSTLEQYVDESYTAYAVDDSYTKVASGIYRIKYDSNNCSGEYSYSGVLETGTSTTLADSDTFTYTNCTFKCWNTQADGSGTNYEASSGFTITENTTLYAIWTVNDDVVAKIEETGAYYTDLAEAISGTDCAAEDGQTVTLLDNVTLSSGLTVWVDITLDLGDYIISYSSESGTDAAIHNYDGLTITADNGGISATYGCRVIQNSHSSAGTSDDVLTIVGGTYTGGGASTIYNDSNATLDIVSGTVTTTSVTSTFRTQIINYGILNISGGSIIGYKAINISGGTVTISGGYIYGSTGLSSGSITITGGYFTEDPTEYVATGYETVTLTSEDEEYANGYRYTVSYTGPTFYGKNIVLDGQIGVKFYIDCTDVTDYSDYSVKFNFNGQDSTASLSEATLYSNSIYYVTLDVPCWLMGSTITAQIYKGDDAVGDPIEYSVQTYVTRMSSSTTVSDQFKALIKAMLNYGYYAEYYYAEENSTSVSSATVTGITPSVDGVDTIDDSSSLSGSKVISATLVLDKTCELRFYVDDGYAVTLIDGQTPYSDTDDDGKTYYAIQNILVQSWDTGHTVVVSDSNGDVACTLSNYSVMSYANTVISDTEGNYTDAHKNLVKAMYLYNFAADAYIDSLS